MLGIIISGHGNFATGLKSNIELIAGNQENLFSVDFDGTCSVDSIKSIILEKINLLNNCDRIVLLVDIQGGTPFNIGSQLVIENNRLHMISGVNTPTLLELCINRSTSIEDIKAVCDSKESMPLNYEMNINSFDEEDEM